MKNFRSLLKINSMKKLNFLFVLFLFSAFQAQVISGTIFSKEENKPIPYVKIGVEKDNLGTVSDESGKFSLDLSKTNTNKNVRIEVSGYEPFSMNVGNFIKQNPQQIFLQEKVQTIKEVKLTPKKLVDKNWGVNTKSKSVTYSVNPEFDKTNFLGETAIQFNTKKRAKIRTINLNVAQFNSKEPVVMRYTIYNDENGLPGKSLLDEEITVELTSDKIKDGVFSLDVNNQNIWVKGKFYVGIQFLKAFDGNIRISAALFKTGYIREFYQDWQKMSIAAPAINIDVKVDKSAVNGSAEKDVFDNVSASLQDYTLFLEEARKSGFGKNTLTGRVLHLKDADIYYETYGKGEPLFLLHGNGGSIDAFTKEIPELSKHFQVIAMDTRAQGKSTDTSTESLTYRKFAEDVKALADELKLKKINILGWSDGGNTAIEFAIKYPKNVNKIITSGANVFPNGVGEKMVEDMKIDVARMKAEHKPERDIRLEQLMIDEPKITKEQLNKISAKALIVAGENDLILRSHTEYIAKEIPNSKMKIYKGASHGVPVERAEELCQDVIDFIKK